MGSKSAFLRISTPTVSSAALSLKVSNAAEDLIKTVPPPGTIPDSTAALVADSASSTLCFFSFISISVAAPTLRIATPPDNLAKRSWSFSLS